MIYYVFWRSYTPYVTQEEVTILASRKALPAPPRARFCLAIAMLFACACMILIVLNAIHGKPVWSLEGNFGPVLFIPLIIVTSAMFRKPFATMFPSGR